MFNIRNVALNVAADFSKVSGKIHMPFTHKLLTSADYREIKKVIKPGMFFVTRTRGELTTLLIPGFWTHVAVVTSRCSVVEATGHGVVETDLIDFIMTRDYAALLDLSMATDEQRALFAQFALSVKGAEYDYKFESNNKKFYCSELGYQAIMEHCPEAGLGLRKRLGQYTIVPEDFWAAKTKFNTIWMSASLIKELAKK